MLLASIDEYCITSDMAVCFHQGGDLVGEKYKRIYSVDVGYIPYPWIVKRSQLVIFTGSACLQTICHEYGKPMFFVPVLSEQFFWAKAHRHKTGIDYMNIFRSKKDFKRDIEMLNWSRIVTPSHRVRAYLLAVMRDIRKHAASDDAYHYISRRLRRDVGR